MILSNSFGLPLHATRCERTASRPKPPKSTAIHVKSIYETTPGGRYMMESNATLLRTVLMMPQSRLDLNQWLVSILKPFAVMLC